MGYFTFIVIAGFLEEQNIVLVTDDLDKAINKYIEIKIGEIQIWNSEKFVCDFGSYQVDTSLKLDEIKKTLLNRMTL